MAQRKLRFALFGNVYQAKKSVSIQKILSFLSENKADIYIEKEFYEALTEGQHLEVKATRCLKDMTSRQTSLSPWAVTERF